MTLPLMVLAVLSVIGGVLNIPSLFGEGMAHWMSHFFDHSILGLSAVEAVHLSNGDTILLMVSASVLTLIALFVSYLVYVKKNALPVADSDLKGWEKWSARKLYVDEIYEFLFVKPILWISDLKNSVVENGFKEGIYTFAATIGKTGNVVRKWQTGNVSSYLLWMVFGIVGLIMFYIIKK